MANSLRSLAVLQFAMELDSLPGGKVLLFKFELSRQIEQAEFLFLLGDHFVKKREVVPEENDAGWVVDPGVFADVALEEDGSHRGDVFVTEAQVGLGESSIAGLNSGHTNFALLVHHVPRENLFRQRHWTFACFNRRQKNLLLHARDVEWKQTAILNDLTRNFIFSGSELGERDFLSGTNSVNQ